ncbi:ABC transporter substrate-binding protein [Thalassotalea psychrophila]|uniref:ABC transporter substrate-binding protein n=1 Tax=Thalassotalea psychrophila TaxID=3065647 RepID=A0ABY9TT64_9GAMM|nr:ABC transporter substrate-binding protein [Colwelliaceae bacterium SQ149]
MKRLFVISLFIIISFNSIAVEEQLSPYNVINNTGNNLFTRIATEQELLKTSPEVMIEIVEQELMPAIDYKYAAFKILGKHLKKMSKVQKQNFIISMRSYLVKTYATALNQYNNQVVSFEPERPTNGAKIVPVDAIISNINAPDITITFQMRQNRKSKQWKAYDMIIEGVSLLATKRAEINSRIAKSDIDQVTLELAVIRK